MLPTTKSIIAAPYYFTFQNQIPKAQKEQQIEHDTIKIHIYNIKKTSHDIQSPDLSL